MDPAFALFDGDEGRADNPDQCSRIGLRQLRAFARPPQALADLRIT